MKTLHDFPPPLLPFPVPISDSCAHKDVHLLIISGSAISEMTVSEITPSTETATLLKSEETQKTKAH